MLPTQQGSFRFFRFKGIDVHVHWSWFLVAIYSISGRLPNYVSPIWALLEYLALFLTVLLHEFGHALACRSVGGSANQIVLWPLGGVAYVAPPPRAGATLWSIAAGPLVNVVLLPIFVGAFYACRAAGVLHANSDLTHFLQAIIVMDVSLLAFNLLPVYPLDGGQILRSILWYPLGRARSLKTATIIGLIGGAALLGLAVWWLSLWTGVMALFLVSQCWRSYQQSGALRRLEQLPRRAGFKCPVCHAAPPIGEYWVCPACKGAFDPFATNAICPRCQTALALTTCVDCHNARPQRSWDASIVDV
jgi:Zn-dependent protease